MSPNTLCMEPCVSWFGSASRALLYQVGCIYAPTDCLCLHVNVAKNVGTPSWECPTVWIVTDLAESQTTCEQHHFDGVHSCNYRRSCPPNALCSQHADGHAWAWPLRHAPIQAPRSANGAPSCQASWGGPRCPPQQANSAGPSKN